MGKKLAFWGDCNGYGYKIIRILEKLGGINVSNYAGNEVILLYYIDKKNHIKGTYNGDLDKEKYVIMTYHDFISKYPFQVGDTVYSINTHEKGDVFEIAWDETRGEIEYYVDFESSMYWVSVNDIFCYEAKDNSDYGTAIKPMKVKSNTIKLVDDKVVDNLDEGKTMDKKLAIKGHSTRGNEVIEILEMMGGKISNECTYESGFDIDYFFFICEEEKNLIDGISYKDKELLSNYTCFTLEEFLEKYPFKVGDKVFLYDNITIGCVTGMKWEENTVKYCVYTSAECWCDVKELLKWNALDLVERHYGEQCEEMLKDITLKHLYELGMENIKKEIVTRMDVEDASFILNYMILPNKVDDKLEYKIPDGLEFDVVVDGKIIFKPIKPKYPETYKECCEIVNVCHTVGISYDSNEDMLYNDEVDLTLLTLRKLLICRNAYWKIAGEEMGLDKPWDSTYGRGEWGYWFGYSINENKIYLQDSRILVNHTLVFPTAEMRDAFYENFKDLIETCKELV